MSSLSEKNLLEVLRVAAKVVVPLELALPLLEMSKMTTLKSL